MLYLEDYLEMIEHLPQELRDRFTDMREMDLGIHNNMDELEKRVKLFFNDCKRYSLDNLPQNVDTEFQSIRKEYYKNLEDADEKVHLASQMYDLVDKYLRRLDSELYKFKCELEADNKGITEVLEKRSLELDTPNTTPSIALLQQKENRYDSTYRYTRPRGEKRRDSSAASVPAAAAQSSSEKRQTAVSAIAPPATIETRPSGGGQTAPPAATAPAGGYTLGHALGAGPAIAAAASQAIAATQQMQQGRRTASLKASYEAINSGGGGHGGGGHEYGIGRELAGAAQTAIQAIQQDHANNKKKQKKWHTGGGGGSSSTTSTSNSSLSGATGAASATGVASGTTAPASPALDAAALTPASGAAAEVTDGEWTYDPNEPRYCLCNQVSYGDMVACDNEDCPSEWFHYPCVGITAPPKGKWFCPQCTATMKRRKGRNN
ncbi:unnamed protein product [Phaedon cochleariae]|uniref:Inhibitor of growth protein n=1 Tax=Phaedon cochleariae TaxID=80249 RepID=A0A9N9SL35_PHACE|nr:unnamed protein product [Phaedon cochleariae]